ncbi:MAG: hypothetical protein A3F41_04165 [Coxiella sp. RIFCSPHIGHO2_12_FULL_44_14]|nr:MAG: hypothetical protein A3F41_04165 [Coxiella sp. RIFCSPHIGHO2_12_FULL_44_14]
MIQLKQLSFSRDNKLLLNKADLMIHARQKVGIIGANGSGKTSLILLLQGLLQADQGELTIPKHLKIAHLQQEIPQSEESALHYVIAGDTLYLDLQRQLHLAEEKQDGMAIADIHMRLHEIDGYAVHSKAGRILHGLGFSTPQQLQPLNAFSGGWQMRLNLARLLMTRADILLLDEPTNHLDMEAIVWLETWLKTCPQTILLISHDRDFIDQVVTHIVHLYQQQLKLYPGNYSSFEKQRAEQLAQQQALFEKQQAVQQHLQSYIDRFRYKASKARQAQSRIKMLARMETTAAVQIESPFRFKFKPTVEAGNPMLTLDHVSLGYDKHITLAKINCSVRDGDRIGFIGPNGAGKSTLIKCLAGLIEPLQGKLHRSTKIKVGYFSQHQLELLHGNESPLQHLQNLSRAITDSQARQYLGGFGFSNNDVFREVHSFSGGEKARLVLALIIWQAPNLLLLDEPTNHLDLEMREALNLALQDYQGALILVSHDRHLLNCVTNELWLVANGKVEPFKGDLEDYQHWVITKNKSSEEVKSESKPTAEKPKASNENKRKKLEAELLVLEEKLIDLDKQLADETLYTTEYQHKLQTLISQREKLKETINAVEETLLQLYEE